MDTSPRREWITRWRKNSGRPHGRSAEGEAPLAVDRAGADLGREPDKVLEGRSVRRREVRLLQGFDEPPAIVVVDRRHPDDELGVDAHRGDDLVVVGPVALALFGLGDRLYELRPEVARAQVPALLVLVTVPTPRCPGAPTARARAAARSDEPSRALGRAPRPPAASTPPWVRDAFWPCPRFDTTCFGVSTVEYAYRSPAAVTSSTTASSTTVKWPSVTCS